MPGKTLVKISLAVAWLGYALHTFPEWWPLIASILEALFPCQLVFVTLWLIAYFIKTDLASTTEE